MTDEPGWLAAELAALADARKHRLASRRQAYAEHRRARQFGLRARHRRKLTRPGPSRPVEWGREP